MEKIKRLGRRRRAFVLVVALFLTLFLTSFVSAILPRVQYSGDKKTVEIPFNEAYGTVREDLVVEVTKDKVPDNVTEGQMLQTMTPEGPMNVVVKEINDVKPYEEEETISILKEENEDIFGENIYLVSRGNNGFASATNTTGKTFI